MRAIVLRGAGDRAFSAGADVTEFRPAESRDDARASRQGADAHAVIAAARKPTIAAIHGYCLGGGLEIALACDLRIAAEDAVFGFPETGLAIIPGAGGTQRLPRLVGVGPALWLILTGERIDSAHALRIGLVSAVVGRSELYERAHHVPTTLAGHGPLALAAAKEAILSGTQMPLADGLQLEADLSMQLTNTADRLEGAAAFRERRTPVYRGS